MATTEVKPEYQGLDEDTLEQLRLLDAYQADDPRIIALIEFKRQQLLRGEKLLTSDQISEHLDSVRGLGIVPTYYLDSSFVLSLAKGRVHDSLKVLDVLKSDNTLCASKLVELESLAPALGARLIEEAEAVEKILSFVTEWLSIDDRVLEEAIELVSRNRSLAAADSIHLALCKAHGATFANAERPGRVPNTIESVASLSIYSKP